MQKMARLSLRAHPGMLPDAFILPFNPADADVSLFMKYGIACPPEIARSVLKRRAEYLAGRRAALAALAEAGAITRDLGTSALRAPAWPSGFTGSITHAGNIAAAIALPSAAVCGVGIDIEAGGSRGAIEAIDALVVNQAEVHGLSDLFDHVGRTIALITAFSAKESFYKATAAAVGRIFDFTALKLIRADVDNGILEAEVAEDLAPSLAKGMPFKLGFTLLGDQSVVTTCAW